MKIQSLLLTVVCAGPASMASAQVLFSNGPFSYFQDFNNLASATSDNGWFNDLTIPEWYSNRTSYKGGTGSNNIGSLYSFGEGLSSNDRALGSLPSGSTGDIAYGVQFRNPSSTLTIADIRVTYIGEQWKDGGNTQPQKLVFRYKLGPSATFDVSEATGWTPVPALDFVGPKNSGSVHTLTGNLAENRAPGQAITAILTGVEVMPGQELFLRWFDKRESFANHGLAIDDLTVSWNVVEPTPPPVPEASASVAALAMGGLLASAYRLRQARRC